MGGSEIGPIISGLSPHPYTQYGQRLRCAACLNPVVQPKSSEIGWALLRADIFSVDQLVLFYGEPIDLTLPAVGLIQYIPRGSSADSSASCVQCGAQFSMVDLVRNPVLDVVNIEDTGEQALAFARKCAERRFPMYVPALFQCPDRRCQQTKYVAFPSCSFGLKTDHSLRRVTPFFGKRTSPLTQADVQGEGITLLTPGFCPDCGGLYPWGEWIRAFFFSEEKDALVR